ncbi:MAG TPA: hypothetical protein VF192_04390 [Longimicrobiales bacterium]
MPTRYEFGFGYGEIYRRRQRGGEAMWRRRERWERELPPEERRHYESDYYGLRGSGQPGSYETEFRVRPRSESRSGGPRRRYYRRRPGPRRGRRR